MPGDMKLTQHQTTARRPPSVLTLIWAALLLAAALLIAVECGNSPMNVHLRELYQHYQQQEQQQQQQKQQQQQQLMNRYATRTNMNMPPCPEDLVLKTDPSIISTPHAAIAATAAAATARQPIECLEKIKGNEDDYYIDKDNSVNRHNAARIASNDRWWQEYFAVEPRDALMTETDSTALTPLLGNSGAAAPSARQPTAYLPAMHYNDFYEDLVTDAKSMDVKRGKSSNSCDCKVTNDLKDLGHQYFPRYLLNAVCQTRNDASEPNKKCWRGAICKPLEYKIKVLTLRNGHLHRDTNIVWLPDNLRHLLRFKTVTVTAGCFCAN